MPREITKEESDSDKWYWMIERGEDAARAGLPIISAVRALMDGYSSAENDLEIAEHIKNGTL